MTLISYACFCNTENGIFTKQINLITTTIKTNCSGRKHSSRGKPASGRKWGGGVTKMGCVLNDLAGVLTDFLSTQIQAYLGWDRLPPWLVANHCLI